MTQPLACQRLRGGQGGSRGELMITGISHIVPFIEERTGTDLIDYAPVHSNWFGGRRTSYCAGLLDSKFTSARSVELLPSRNFLARPSFGIKFSICYILILGFQV